MKRLGDKRCVVTGAASGIGEAIARRLAAEGARVVILDLDLEGAKAVAAGISEEGGEAMAFQADVSKQIDVEDAVNAVVERWGGVDVLVNNAGTSTAGAPFPDTTVDDWDRVLRVNLTSQFLCCRAVIPLMLEGGGGSIVNISSVVAKNGIGSPAYAASKAGVLGMTRSLSNRFASSSVRVNAICPGFVWTPMWENICERMGRGRDFFDEHVERYCQTGRAQSKESVAAMAAFLASDDAADVTGQALNVTGGAELH